MEVYQLEESRKGATELLGVGSPKKAGREDPGVRAAKIFEFRKGE